MSCCQGQRLGRVAPARHEATPPAPTVFIHTGELPLQVIGPATGRRYHFSHTGCRLEVHPRDAPALAAVGTLRRVG